MNKRFCIIKEQFGYTNLESAQNVVTKSEIKNNSITLIVKIFNNEN